MRKHLRVWSQLGMAVGSQPARSRQGSIVAAPAGAAHAADWPKLVRRTQAVVAADQPAACDHAVVPCPAREDAS